MSHLVDSFLPALASLGLLGYGLVFVISIAEAMPFVGALIPGSILVMLSGFFAAQGYLDLGSLFWWTVAGSIIGDSIGYYLGTKGNRVFRAQNKFFKLSHLEKGKRFFQKHGKKSIFFGRFLGPIRPIIPFVAGLAKMESRSFYFWNIVSAFPWAASFLLLGYFFGGATKKVQIWSTWGGLGLFLIFMGYSLIKFLRRGRGGER